jgi:acyl-CoA dehydrogenase
MNAPLTAIGSRLADRARRAAAVAATFADAVDAEGRFPREAIEALRAERLLGIMMPVELGGEGASTREIADVAAILGAACAASAMVFAMHQIKVSSLVEHGQESDWHRAFMRRVAGEQLLIASATTEAGIGGNMRNSLCAIEVTDGFFRLGKDASVISYAREADAIMVTSRAHEAAPTTDQVMTVVLKHQFTLEKTHDWNTMGMRGTCSEGFRFESEGDAAQIVPKPFAEIAAQSMLANAHLLWGGLWYGIAADAVARAQAFLKAEARRMPNQTPPGAVALAGAMATLQMLRSTLLVSIEKYEAAKGEPDVLSSVSFGASINLLKVSMSQKILEIVETCLRICGIAGYKNGTPYSLGRHLRDAHSAELMVSNDRILMNTASLVLMARPDMSLMG